MIVKITWPEIYPVWCKKLWPQRKEESIEPFSAMLLGGGYGNNQSYTPTFWGYIFNNAIVGVNSGHACVDGSYRSRGLWVDPEHRYRGIGRALLEKTVAEAKLTEAKFCWSLPRKTSWHVYQSAGFILCSEWFGTETSDANAYVYLRL